MERRYKIDTGESIAVTGVEYHRNGVGGNGFYTVAFRYDKTPLIGIVEHYNAYVIDPADLAYGYRGHDYFGRALRAAVDTFGDRGFKWE